MGYVAILVEGPDCSGKSTVVERLKNIFHWDSKSLHHRPGDQFGRYLREYALGEQIVFDRGHISEHVFAQMWRGGSPFSDEERSILDELCKNKILTIFTCPPVELMQQRYRERGFEQQIQLEELERCRTLFSTTFEKIPHIVYTSQNFAELDQLILRVRKEIENPSH